MSLYWNCLLSESRGQTRCRREAIYLDEGDRGAWLEVLGNVCERFNWVVHAYCHKSSALSLAQEQAPYYRA